MLIEESGFEFLTLLFDLATLIPTYWPIFIERNFLKLGERIKEFFNRPIYSDSFWLIAPIATHEDCALEMKSFLSKNIAKYWLPDTEQECMQELPMDYTLQHFLVYYAIRYETFDLVKKLSQRTFEWSEKSVVARVGVRNEHPTVNAFHGSGWYDSDFDPWTTQRQTYNQQLQKLGLI